MLHTIRAFLLLPLSSRRTERRATQTERERERESERLLNKILRVAFIGFVAATTIVVTVAVAVLLTDVQ
jgi:hypothetical protein